jgi:uncharacterized secreted protein with C-terminal beta-propeller domain
MTATIRMTAMAVALAAALAPAAALAGPAAEPAAASARARTASALPAFSSCGELVRYARRNARRTGGRTGVPTRAGVVVAQTLGAPMPQVAVDGRPAPAATESPQRLPAAPFSQTNVQEAGVDEPDIVKTDGRRVFAIAGGVLRALDASGDLPRLVGSLGLGAAAAHELFVRGDRALIVSTPHGAVDLFAGAPRVVLTEVDVADPTAMTVRRTMTLDGALVDARMTAATARVVVASSPAPLRPAAIERSGVRRWVPRTVLRSRLSGRTFRRSVVACDDVRRPRRFSGLDLLTVLTIDLDRGLFDVDRDAIMAGAQTVYASPSSLYVASRRHRPAVEAGRAVPDGVRTEIHRFDASRAGATAYAASGTVAGFVLNQYSLSEHDGVLRVASTEMAPWIGGARRGDSESFVTVLAQRGAWLARVGRVGGLGRGERIYAVRFAGDRGYVVTFREIDPLYTLDLSNPAAPRVLGELKISGYSAYLHPISDTLLLGIGQDVGDGRALGTQLSLFDVSDPRSPVRRAVASLGDGSSSEAEVDPHAFLFWQPAGLAVVPLRVFGASGEFTGAVGFRLAPGALAEAGRITHPPAAGETAAPPIARSLVIGERLLTLSHAGLAAHRLDTLEPVAFAAFPQPR